MDRILPQSEEMRVRNNYPSKSAQPLTEIGRNKMCFTSILSICPPLICSNIALGEFEVEYLSKWTCSGKSSAWDNHNPLFKLTTSNFITVAWLDGAFWLDISNICYAFNLRAKQLSQSLQRQPILEPNCWNPILEPNSKRLLIIPKYCPYTQMEIA